MRILAVSDLHLTHYNFNEKRFKFLNELIQPYDHVIINGDFWCNFSTTFDRFYNSRWQQLFPFLKEKHTVYITGNHDLYNCVLIDKAMTFADYVGEDYEISDGGNTYQFVHGHQYGLDYVKSPIDIMLRRMSRVEDAILAMQKFATKKLGFERYLQTFGKRLNNRQKRTFGKHPDKFVVMGHTHAAEFDEEKMYINTGAIYDGVYSYLEIVEGKPKLMSSHL